MNKNFLIGFNIVLLVLVGVLFYLHFSSSPKKATVASATTTSDSTTEASFAIAYFDMDSIEQNYEYLKDVRNQLKNKETEMTGQLNQMRNRYMDKINRYKQEAPTMSQERQSVVEQELMNDQKVIQNKEQALGMELQDVSIKKMQEVNKRIEDYLKEYNKEKGYSYILAHQPGSIYYKDPKYDITTEVLKGLNENYKKKN